MNKDNAAEFIPLVQALADGKTIQMLGVKTWMDSTECSFSYPLDHYRIKPELYEAWVNVYPNEFGDQISSTEDEAEQKAAANCIRTIHVREVVE